MRRQMIFYYESDGRITNKMMFDEKHCDRMIAANPGLACMPYDGAININKYRVNVSVTPHVIEAKSEVTINIPIYIRDLRNKYLAICDWTQSEDSPLSDAKKAEWATYRQALRDMPETFASATSVDDVVWPSRPS